MFKIKVNKEEKISRLFSIAQKLTEDFPFVTGVSIDSVNLEEIFWNMNNEYKSLN